MTITRRQFGATTLATGAALFAPHTARAQDWPTRPVRFIVHLAAGGGLDFIARLVGENLSRQFGQQVFIENRTGGAGGTIGIEAGVEAPPGGHKFLCCNEKLARAAPVVKLNVE